jgi:predicted ATPase
MREWILEKTIHNSVFLSFNDLAEGNRNINDYKILIDRFSNIYLTDVPIFTSRNLDSCRRFMSFIDILYDQNKSLWMEAHQFPTDLYQDQNNSLPFNRTSSRLAELLS